MKPKLAPYAVIVPLLFCAADAPGSDAKIKSEIKFKTRDLEKIQSELKKKEEETERILQESKELSSEITKNKNIIQDIEQTLENTGMQSKHVQGQIAKTKNVKDTIEEKYYDNSREISGKAHQYFVASTVMGASALPPVFLRQLLHRENQRNEELGSEKRKMAYEYDELVATQKSLQDELSRQKNVLSKVRNSYDTAQTQLKKKESRRQIIESELRELKKTAQELTSMIDLLRTQEKSATEEATRERRAKQMSGQSPILSKSLIWPVTGTIIEKFGRHNNPEFGTPYNSNGIRIKLDAVAPVKAVSQGRVLYAGNFMSFGSMVLMEHPGDWYSVYGHLGDINVGKGQEIKEGDVVGSTGMNEKAFNEMYFELRFYGKPVDPLPWLKD